MTYRTIDVAYNVSGLLTVLGALSTAALVPTFLELGRWTEVLTWMAVLAATELLAGVLGWNWASRRHDEWLDREYPHRNDPEPEPLEREIDI